MKVKKSLFALLTAAVLSVSLFSAACGDGDGDNPTIDGDAPDIVQPTRTVDTTKLTVYEAPELLESSQKLKAYADGTELFVYETRVNHDRIFSYSYSKNTGQVVNFDFEGKVHMKVEINGAQSLTDVVVRPLSYGVQTSVSGNTVEFDLQYCANYTLEYNDGTVEDAADNALHIFANPIETNPVSADSVPDDVIYIGPGVYSAGAIPMTSNKTVYLAGGAYVYGQIRAEGLENITIRGRGIISGDIYDRTKASEYTLPIELRHCKNVTIEGLAFLDPAGWAITLYFCDGVKVDNVKVITARANGDGISVQSCKNVTVTGGFVRTWDDSLVVKNSDRGTTDNITFDNVTVWTDLAQSCEVGYETYGATMNNINFKNITIVHNYHKAALSIHNSDDADITNVTYQSITIEDARMLGDNRLDGENDFLIDITIAYSTEWTQSGGERGTVENIKFENIKVLSMADSIVSRINGESPTSKVQNVTISGVEIEGKRIKSASELKLSNNTYASGINVADSSYQPFGAGVALPYILDLKNSTVDKTVVPSVSQNGLEVPEFAILDVQETYMGVKLDLSGAQFKATHGVGTQVASPYDDGAWEDDPTVAAAFDDDRSTSYVAKNWTGQDNEFAALTVDFGEQVSPGVVRVKLAEDSNYVYDFSVGVFVKRTADAKNFVRSVSTAKYTASPANGNYFDIKLPATLKCVSLQLRIFRTDGMTGQQKLEINEISFYPCSLSTTQPVVDSTEHNDVYVADYLVDGNENTYWEAKTQEASFTVDLNSVYSVKYVIMHLPPLLTWDARVQQIEIQVSVDGNDWTTIQAKQAYTFDPMTGNSNSVVLETPVQARYVKLIFSSNTGGYGAQLSELYVYGE